MKNEGAMSAFTLMRKSGKCASSLSCGVRHFFCPAQEHSYVFLAMNPIITISSSLLASPLGTPKSKEQLSPSNTIGSGGNVPEGFFAVALLVLIAGERQPCPTVAHHSNPQSLQSPATNVAYIL